MSPAKRKTAKSGRATSVAARGGKARGKARGSALTKAVKVKGKTPAKRGDHRLAARGGAKIGARNGKGVACDLPREQLELLLDREEGRADVLTHVPACHPCTTSLTVIASQRDAIRHLTAEPSGTAVEYLLERGARAGARKLADLVYELAKACLVEVKDVDRRVHLATRPRVQREIERDVRGVALRIENGERQAIASRLPLGKPDEATALTAAESCIRILERLEGETARQKLSKAVWLISTGSPPAAERVLEGVIAVTATGINKRAAFWNLLWALNEQRAYSRTLERGADAIREFPDDWILVYNLAVAAACTGNRNLFHRYGEQLRRLPLVSEHAGFRSRLLDYEVVQFAEKLGVDRTIIEQTFGLPKGTRSGSHEAN